MRTIYNGRQSLNSDEVVAVLKGIFMGYDSDDGLFDVGRYLESIHNDTSWDIFQHTPRSP